jgi:hypothetical protein
VLCNLFHLLSILTTKGWTTRRKKQFAVMVLAQRVAFVAKKNLQKSRFETYPDVPNSNGFVTGTRDELMSNYFYCINQICVTHKGSNVFSTLSKKPIIIITWEEDASTRLCWCHFFTTYFAIPLNDL